MEAARKLIQCECTAVSDLSCNGCGKPVCTECSTVEICSFDAKNIQVKHYCPHCSQDAAKNTWGALYWKELVSLFV
jgi:hypothetical protein